MGDAIRNYYSLTKPGVLYGNVLTAAAGFLLASRGHVHFWLFMALIVGMTLVIASACVTNNYLDQDIDQKMARTKQRALVAGKVSGRGAVIFGAMLGIVGAVILFLYTNALTGWIGIVGWIVYVVFYGMLSKRLSIHGTLVGSVSGAMPILGGYCAVTNHIDAGAIIIFLVLFLWQMPEFYSIAIYRRDEYKAAGIPVMSVIKGVTSTKIQILVYTVLFVAATLALTVFGYTGYIYLAVMGLLGLYWLWLAIKGITAADSNAWARRMFRFSLIMLLAFSFMVSIDSILV